MIRTILTPIDGSAHAQLAVELGADLAAKYDARLILMHVGAGDEDVPEELFNAAARELKEAEDKGEDTGIPPHPSQRVRVLAWMGKVLLATARRFAEGKGVKTVETIVDLGDPAEKIVHHARDRTADLVVMGSRGWGELTGLVLGSVSHEVLQLAPCSCVTVHRSDAKDDELSTILVPTDGSDQADKAVELASDIAARTGARLTLLYVTRRGPSLQEFRSTVDMDQLSEDTRNELDPERHPIAETISSAIMPPVLSEEAQKEIGEQVLERGRQTAEAKGAAKPNLVLLDGDPARKIAQAAKSEHADLIAMGSRGLTGAKGLLTGSVSYKVTHAAPCSCMVVR